jgi:hypothetical protein
LLLRIFCCRIAWLIQLKSVTDNKHGMHYQSVQMFLTVFMKLGDERFNFLYIIFPIFDVDVFSIVVKCISGLLFFWFFSLDYVFLNRVTHLY